MEFSKTQIKVLNVIESCTTELHLKSAEVYLSLFFKKEKDLAFIRFLLQKFNEKIDEITAAPKNK